MARFTRQWGCSPPRWIPELNGAGDNPLVLGEDREILSTGNFNTAALALALDTVALAVFQTASICAQRTQRLLTSSLTGLSENLSPHGSEHSGYAPLIKTVAGSVGGDAAPQLPVSPQTPGRAPHSSKMTPATPRPPPDVSGRCSTASATYSRSRRWSPPRRSTSPRPGGSAADLPCSTKLSGSASSPLDEDRASTDDIEQIAADLFGPTAIETLLNQSGIGANWSLGERAGW